MAKYIVEYDNENIVKTLSFSGKDYTEIWEEDGTYCECGIEALVSVDYPNLAEENEEVASAIEMLSDSSEDEILGFMQVLTDFEGFEDSTN